MVRVASIAERYRCGPMPPSRKARTAQNRQKDRLAVAAIEKSRVRRRQRIIRSVIALLILFAFGGFLWNLSSNQSTEKPIAEPGTTSSFTTTSTTFPPRNCVKMKTPPPAGAPVVPVPTGMSPAQLYTKDLIVGKGPTVAAGATVNMKYIGVACTTGVMFDENFSKPGTLPANLDPNAHALIEGWIEGIPGMKIGGERLLGIPAHLAYGLNGPTGIGSAQPLWFVVKAVSLANSTATPST
ncbi:MAG TPA: FKBP-type peptidyl-prolyl cis-trans isomerase [Acidimicrobiia bacterium]|nr:FKBP-type peptidyl-prolyl cis-trans isomerase [Acidimicrobiia bacterium]